ncbi:hypothetical protein Tco_1213047 [Tanacetum coccineum]
MMVVMEIENELLEEVKKLEWWFEQDIDDEGEEDEEDGGGDKVGGLKIQKKRQTQKSHSPLLAVLYRQAVPNILGGRQDSRDNVGRGRDVLRRRRRVGMIHHHLHQWCHPTDEMKMDDLK